MLRVYSLSDADNTPKLTELSADYQNDFVLAIVDYICHSVERFKSTRQEGRENIASALLRKAQGQYRYGHLKLFADMLIDGDLPVKRGQVEERKLILFDRQSVMERWHVFVDVVNAYIQEQDSRMSSELATYQTNKRYEEAVPPDPEQWKRIKEKISGLFDATTDAIHQEAKRLYHEDISKYYKKGIATGNYSDYYEVCKATWAAYIPKAREQRSLT